MFERPIEGEGLVMEQPAAPPFEDSAPERAMIGRIRKERVEMRINLMKWSQRADVNQAWDRIVQREGVKQEGLEKATWMFLGIILGRNADFVISMSKARKLGWTGYKDTWKALQETFDKLETEKIIPRIRV
jgi:hypothetical protein